MHDVGLWRDGRHPRSERMIGEDVERIGGLLRNPAAQLAREDQILVDIAHPFAQTRGHRQIVEMRLRRPDLHVVAALSHAVGEPCGVAHHARHLQKRRMREEDKFHAVAGTAFFCVELRVSGTERYDPIAEFKRLAASSTAKLRS